MSRAEPVVAEAGASVAGLSRRGPRTAAPAAEPEHEPIVPAVSRPEADHHGGAAQRAVR